VAAVQELQRRLIPAIQQLRDTLAGKSQAFDSIVKIGRTHLQDATPLTLGQEFPATWRNWIMACAMLKPHGACVRTGTGWHGGRHWAQRAPGIRRARSRRIVASDRLPFVTAPNKFEALASNDALVHAHGALKTLAASLMKIATIFAGWHRDRVAVSVNYASLKMNRAAPSCRAKSTDAIGSHDNGVLSGHGQ